MATDKSGKAAPDVNRSESRMRTKLRTGTISNTNGQPICECLIFDRSPKGARIKLASNIQLPNKVIFYDSTALQSGLAQVRWRREAEVGLYMANGCS